ncbi:MAG: GH3 auxin-responsive promoter family protein [Clostridia bacterium]|nr:GH3 auxin-responsive promoter family protein [Clostridia bacterium]
MDNRKQTAVDKGKEALKVLKENCHNATEFSKNLLMQIVRDNENTEFGREHHFKDIKTLEDYKKKIPFSTYDSYAKQVERMTRGEQNILTVYPIVHYATTSGSIGVAKNIPVSIHTLQLYGEYTSNIATALIDGYIKEKEGREMKHGKRLLTAIVTQGEVADGTSRGSISGKMYEHVKDYMLQVVASPADILFAKEKMDFKYLKSFYALKEENITSIAAPFTTAVYDLLHYIELNWQSLCDDIENGVISPKCKISDEVRSNLEAELSPDPKRAEFLRKEFKKGFDEPFVRRIWKDMEYINAIGSGGFRIYTDKLRRYTGDIPMTFSNYAASEAMFAVVTEVESMDYTLIPQGGFYEFLPVDIADEPDEEIMTKTKNLNELEVGKEYEIIVTNLSGFYRYRIGDIITVVGYEGESPKICFYCRKNQMLSIAGEKTNESCVLSVIDSFCNQTGVDVKDYSVYADNEISPGRYVLFMEPTKPLPKEKHSEYRDITDKAMCTANPSYGAKIQDGILSPMAIHFVEQETYALYRDVMLMRGVSENQLKPVSIIDTPFKEKFFFGLIDDN